MNHFKILFPSQIFFGFGSIDNLKTLGINKKNILIVTGCNSSKENGSLMIIKKLLGKNNKIFVFDRVEPEVSVETVDHAAEFARKKNIDLIIGLGGGSAIDCAKAVSGIFKRHFSVKRYLDNKVKIKKRYASFIAIPTTAGTGAEVTKNAVLTYTEKNIKISLRSEKLIPDIVICDPAFLSTVSKKWALTPS